MVDMVAQMIDEVAEPVDGKAEMVAAFIHRREG